MAESKRRSAIRQTAGDMKERFASNPFLDETALVPRIRKIKRQVDGITVEDKDTGITVPVFYHGERRIDTEPFLKLFDAMWGVLPFMSRSGLYVLAYVRKQTRPGNAVVYLDRDEFVAMGHARSTYYNGLDELLTFQMLARSAKRKYYYINPSCFFNGNRLHMRHEFKPNAE